MSLFNFNQEEMLTFFAVLVRFSVIFTVIPLIGDRLVPGTVKILLALAVTIALFPALVASGTLKTIEAKYWGATVAGITGTLALEVVFGLALGFVARLAMESITIGANFIGAFMGFASASMFDPHQESQTEVVAQIQTVIAMLLFLAMDSHHLILRTILDSYRVVGLGKADLSGILSQRLIEYTGETLKFGIQISAPMAISIFMVNITLGVMSKAMPQLNILVLSFAATAAVGFLVLFMGLGEFQNVVNSIIEKMVDWMQSAMLAMKGT